MAHHWRSRNQAQCSTCFQTHHHFFSINMAKHPVPKHCQHGVCRITFFSVPSTTRHSDDSNVSEREDLPQYRGSSNIANTRPELILRHANRFTSDPVDRYLKDNDGAYHQLRSRKCVDGRSEQSLRHARHAETIRQAETKARPREEQGGRESTSRRHNSADAVGDHHRHHQQYNRSDEGHRRDSDDSGRSRYSRGTDSNHREDGRRRSSDNEHRYRRQNSDLAFEGAQHYYPTARVRLSR